MRLYMPAFCAGEREKALLETVKKVSSQLKASQEAAAKARQEQDTLEEAAKMEVEDQGDEGEPEPERVIAVSAPDLSTTHFACLVYPSSFHNP